MKDYEVIEVVEAVRRFDITSLQCRDGSKVWPYGRAFEDLFAAALAAGLDPQRDVLQVRVRRKKPAHPSHRVYVLAIKVGGVWVTGAGRGRK